jgi:hypothetical protein
MNDRYTKQARDAMDKCFAAYRVLGTTNLEKAELKADLIAELLRKHIADLQYCLVQVERFKVHKDTDTESIIERDKNIAKVLDENIADLKISTNYLLDFLLGD